MVQSLKWLLHKYEDLNPITDLSLGGQGEVDPWGSLAILASLLQEYQGYGSLSVKTNQPTNQ